MDNAFVKKTIEEGTRIDQAMDRAFYAAVRLHRMHGIPLVIWEDDRVQYIDPHDILLPEEQDSHGGNRPR